MSIKRMISVMCLVGFLAGCGSLPFRSSTDSSLGDRQISQDLVNVIYQVDTLNPQSATLMLPDTVPASSSFSTTLIDALQSAGYAIRTTGGEAAGSLSVSYSVGQSVDISKGEVFTYTVNVGHVSVRRTYQPQRSGGVQPLSVMQIRGADASRISMNDDIFGPNDKPAVQQVPPPATIAVLPTPPSSAQAATPAPPVATVQAPQEVVIGVPKTVEPIIVQPLESADTLASDQPRTVTPNSTLDNSLFERPKQNVLSLGGSNFADILNTLGTVDEAVLIFDNDSTILGPGNKARVREFVAQFDTERDVFSVIGCSHGPTAVDGGQETLALGRAERIREELLFAGVPNNQILDEGCWAHDQYDKRMPRRGVVLALKRRT